MAQPYGKPKPGDLIEIPHGIYSHWAIYVGDGYVVHLTDPDNLSRASSSAILPIRGSKAVVRQDRLRDLVGRCSYRINNYLDHKYKPLPVEKIIRSAKEKIGETMEYNPVDKNCEHFVTKLRYGVSCSKQVVRKSLGQPSTTADLLKRAPRQEIGSRSRAYGIAQGFVCAENVMLGGISLAFGILGAIGLALMMPRPQRR
ncbi:phospholipase A and acyltransferase 4 isoform X1 [Crocuta crocuta]